MKAILIARVSTESDFAKASHGQGTFLKDLFLLWSFAPKYSVPEGHI